MTKPYSAACEQNRAPILAVIQPLLTRCGQLLEIGSGTGQHAVYLGEQLPHLQWQTSDVPDYHPAILAWLSEAALDNVLPPLTLDVSQPVWPELVVDAVFTANTLHIMSWPEVVACFAGVGRLLETGGLLLVYGPFNYQGQYTSESNARFDQWLQERDPASGVRDFEALDLLAESAGMRLQADYEMPANNRILCWQKR